MDTVKEILLKLAEGDDETIRFEFRANTYDDGIPIRDPEGFVEEMLAVVKTAHLKSEDELAEINGEIMIRHFPRTALLKRLKEKFGNK